MTNRILLVEDEQKLRRILKLVLLDEGYDVQTAADGQAVITTWQQLSPDLVITDLKMKEIDGMMLLKKVSEEHPAIVTVMMTACAALSLAGKVIKLSAPVPIWKS